jgi:nitrite reductase/ring-hydroxylating ferredoxin subunit
VERSAELDIIRRFLAHLEAGTTDLAPSVLRVPAAVYTSESHLEREQRHLFRGQPVIAGLSADLPRAGSFFSLQVGGIPLIVVRHSDGVARAFVNGCRHRGGRLVEGRGCAGGGTLRCPFHAWTYRTDGELQAIPEAEQAFAELDRSRLGLRARPCVERDGLLLVRAEGDRPIDPDDALRGVAPDLRSPGLERFQHHDTRVTHWRCNWKLILDTFLESYHVFSLHRESVHPWYLSHPMTFDGWGCNLRFPVARRTLAELGDEPEERWSLADHATIQWLVGASTLITATRDYALIWQFSSKRPGACSARTSLYSARPVTSEAQTKRLDEALDLQLDVTGREDFPMQEAVQEVLDSGAVPEVLFGRNEVAAIHFHQAVDALLARETSAAERPGHA